MGVNMQYTIEKALRLFELGLLPLKERQELFFQMLNNRDSFSALNALMKSKHLMTEGQQNICVILVTQSDYTLSRYYKHCINSNLSIDKIEKEVLNNDEVISDLVSHNNKIM
jgi:hypothetical protein